VQEHIESERVIHWHGTFPWPTSRQKHFGFHHTVFVDDKSAANPRTTISKPFTTSIQNSLGKVSSVAFLSKAVNLCRTFSSSVYADGNDILGSWRSLHNVCPALQVTTLQVFPLVLGLVRFFKSLMILKVLFTLRILRARLKITAAFTSEQCKFIR